MRIKPIPFILILVLFQIACVEPFEIDFSLNDEEIARDILVIEAVITDEMKHQTVNVSVLDSLGTSTLGNGIENAQVSIVDGSGTTYGFIPIGGGRYESQDIFAAISNTTYTLRVSVDGNDYTSTQEVLPATASINELYARRITNDNGVDGVGIFLNPLGDGESLKFRYEFEETYEIIAPLWAPFDMVVVDRNPPFAFELVPRDRDTQRCFGTRRSTDIVLSSDLDFENNIEQDFLVQFISSEDPVIQHRYSILVSQFSQSTNAHAFYSTLRQQSTSSNVFSQIQPGFIEGNIGNLTNSDNRVVGFFSVESVTTERIFFDYEDFYPDEELPPYFINCNFLGAPIPITPAGTSPLIDAIDSGNFVWVRNNEGEVPEGGPYLIARTPCGNCTVLGSNVIPEFWEE